MQKGPDMALCENDQKGERQTEGKVLEKSLRVGPTSAMRMRAGGVISTRFPSLLSQMSLFPLISQWPDGG